MAATIEDVAHRAGVSIATVSRALRGLPDVAPPTRERVVRAARDLDYVASPYAARLASGRTHAVGVAVPFVTRWFFTQVVAGAERVLREAGYDTLLYNLGGQAGRERFFGRMPVRKRVDGLLMLCTPLAEGEIEAVRALRLPVAPTRPCTRPPRSTGGAATGRRCGTPASGWIRVWTCPATSPRGAAGRRWSGCSG